MAISFTDDEIETIKSLISDHGHDDPDTDYNKILELEYKLGLSVRPTDEEIIEQERRRKEFVESPYGKQMMEIFKISDSYLIRQLENFNSVDVLYGTKNLIGSTLRIRLPND